MAIRAVTGKTMLLTLSVFLSATVMATETDGSFYTLTRQQGLSSNCVISLLQLHDGRMVAVTDSAVDVYDGQRFTSVPIDTALWSSLPAYHGAAHLFADRDNGRLWMKHWGRLFCFDLRTMRQTSGKAVTADDFFIDDVGETWLLHRRKLTSQKGRVLHLPQEAGNLQDLVSHADSIYAFFGTGRLIVYDNKGRQAYHSDAYDADAARRYAGTSLVVRGADGCFYQVRTGSGGAILLAFNPRKRQWRTLQTNATWMHTLTATPTGGLYLTTPDGYLRLHPQTGEQQTFNELHLPDGTVLSTGINTVWLDREGGIWLGTYQSGLLYTSPLSGIFDTRPINIDVFPILTTIYLHGQPLQVGHEYGGRTLLQVVPPYAESLTLSHDQNALAFQFATMNYVRPRSTCYRYRFSGEGDDWHTLSADSAAHLVDDKGVLYLPLVGLAPGRYTLEVMATTTPGHWDTDRVRRLTFTILPPWWQSPWAYILYIMCGLLLAGVAFLLYRRRLERRSREQMLLLRIQNLVEQVNQYNSAAPALVVLSEPEPDGDAEQEVPASPEPEPSAQEKEFMARATQLVEQHLGDPSYGVEQLAADLCMERTGLYKKLTALMQQPPVAFIRSIRLHRAAEMLRRGQCSIGDIAERTGFSSPSYFSKCFQKEFGCKPSEYTDE